MKSSCDGQTGNLQDLDQQLLKLSIENHADEGYSADPNRKPELGGECPSVRGNASSIDIEYEEFMQNYANDDFLSKLGIEISSNDKDILEADRNTAQSNTHSSRNSEESKQEETWSDLNILSRRGRDEINGSTSPVQFWRGYGHSIYFHPMTCKTLPLMKINLNGRKAHCFRFLRKAKQEETIEARQKAYLLKTPAKNNEPCDHGSLRFTCSEDRMDSGKINRVGNFVLTKERKEKVCKGFVSRKLMDIQARQDTNVVAIKPVNAKPFLKKCSENKVSSVKTKNTGKHKPENRSSRSKDVGNGRSKGKAYMAAIARKTNANMKNVKMVNILPFQKVVSGERFKRVDLDRDVERPLYTTPVGNEDVSYEMKETPDRNVVTEYAKDVLKSKQAESTNKDPEQSEHRYAYNTLFTYFNGGPTLAKGSQMPAPSPSPLSKTLQSPNNRKSRKEFVNATDFKSLIRKKNAASNESIDDVRIIGITRSQAMDERNEVCEESDWFNRYDDHNSFTALNSAFSSSDPFETNTAKLLHRYKIPSPDNCRLPIIGRKIP